jgi:mxaJ protein
MRCTERQLRHTSTLIAVLALWLVPGASAAEGASAGVLRVCADPNNLPFSDRAGHGFENKLAEMLAADLHRRLEYSWWAQRRGALRNTLKAGLCDVVLGVPTSLELVAATEPYYRSSYVFVSKRARGLNIDSFDDPRLRQLLIGVQVVGDDYANTPPVHALSLRGISNNVRGYSVLGDYAEPTPAGNIMRALELGAVDIALVWGPLAGYFAQRSREPLRLVPMPPSDGGRAMRFDIGMGVRRKDGPLKERLNDFIARRKGVITSLLESYGVPQP